MDAILYLIHTIGEIHMKRIFCILLLICFILGIFCSCGDSKKSKSSNVDLSMLIGSWETVEKLEDYTTLKTKFTRTEENQSGFYEEEIALMNFDDICAVKVLTFTETDDNSGLYEYTYDKDATYSYLSQFYGNFISVCYENIEMLSDCYGPGIVESISSYEDFKTFYCGIFGCSSYDDLIDTLCGFVFNSELYESFADKGIFTLDGNMILMTSIAEDDTSDSKNENNQNEEKVGAAIQDGELVLSYKSGTEIYNKRQ